MPKSQHMLSQRTCVRHETPLTNTTNRNRDTGLCASETHMCVCATSLTTGSLLLPHAITTTPHTRVCVTTHRLLRPQTVAVAVTTDSLTLKHTSARQQMYEHHTSTACDIAASAPGFCMHAQSESNPGNWKRDQGPLASSTPMCVRAVTQ